MRFIFTSDVNICSPTKPKPTEHKICSQMAACSVFPATPNLFYHSIYCHLNSTSAREHKTALTSKEDLPKSGSSEFGLQSEYNCIYFFSEILVI